MHNHTDRAGALAGAIFLFGLAFLLYTGTIWPFIMPLIWLTSVPVLVTENGIWRGLFGLVPAVGIFLVGIPFLITTGTIWPFILPLIWLGCLPVLITEGGWSGLWGIVQSGLWLGGLGTLFWLNFPLVPGILLLCGLSALLVAFAPRSVLRSGAQRDRPDRQPVAEPAHKRKNVKRKNDDNLPLAPVARRLSDLEPAPDDDRYEGDLYGNDFNSEDDRYSPRHDRRSYRGEAVPVPHKSHLID